MKKIYIAGPMTGLPDNNYPAFNAAAAELRAQGHMVANPAENEPPSCGTWLGYMRLALAQLILCDTVHLLPGWIHSRGAVVEYTLAKGLGLDVQSAVGAEAAPQVELPKPDMWRDEKGLRGYTVDPGNGPWYAAETVRTLLAKVPTAPVACGCASAGAQARRIEELEIELLSERRHHGAMHAAAVLTLTAMGYAWRGGSVWAPVDTPAAQPVEVEACHASH